MFLEETAATVCRVDSEERDIIFSEISMDIFQTTRRHFPDLPEVAALRISDLNNNIEVLMKMCGNYRRRRSVYMTVIMLLCNVCDL
jgi:hypothetical protein